MGKKHGHHGGAWKVAYADFVTALMALFMVLWIVAQDDEILIATSRYFQQPFHSPLPRASGVMKESSLQGQGSAMNKMNDNLPSTNVDIAFLHNLAKEFYRLLNIDQAKEDERPIDIQVTADGLRITIFDRPNQPLFKEHSSQFTSWGNVVLQNLAWIIDRHQLSVRIDAHTSRGMKADNPEFGPFELTAEQANAARRKLVFYALDPDKVSRVSAFGDNEPLPKMGVEAPENQRLVISLEAPKMAGSRR